MKKKFEEKRVLLSQRVFKVGYILKKEKIWAFPNESALVITAAYLLSGEYIGDSKTAAYLFSRGIIPQLIDWKHKVCAIGFCKKEQKWYGWSHRALSGFKIGDKVKKGDCTNSSGTIESYLKKHPELDLSLPIGFTAKTLLDAKRMAIAFADSVG